jgi:hypothetical protein
MLEIKANWQGALSENLFINEEGRIIIPFPNQGLDANRQLEVFFENWVADGDDPTGYHKHATKVVIPITTFSTVKHFFGIHQVPQTRNVVVKDNLQLREKNVVDWSIDEWSKLFHQLQPATPPYKSYKPIALLNCAIITADGEYRQRPVSLEWVRETVANNEIISAIGHDSTAQIMTELLGVEVPVNRIQFEQQAGQDAIVFKLNGRAPEGKILTQEEIETIGYSFKFLERTF